LNGLHVDAGHLRLVESTKDVPMTSVAAPRIRARIPIRSATSTACPRTSTPLPPVRNPGERSTTVGLKPCLASQNATVGPAMLAPEIRIRSYMTLGLVAATRR
jgi:hypothetical protein